MRFGLALSCTLENKENARPYVIREDADGDTGDGQVLYREDYDDEKSECLPHQVNWSSNLRSAVGTSLANCGTVSVA